MASGSQAWEPGVELHTPVVDTLQRQVLAEIVQFFFLQHVSLAGPLRKSLQAHPAEIRHSGLASRSINC